MKEFSALTKDDLIVMYLAAEADIKALRRQLKRAGE